MRIRKAVVTAAGWGTRFLPATKAQPKEMLPIVDKPMIQYVVEEAVASDIAQIIIVTAIGKRAISDHFDHSFELENALRRKGDVELLEKVQRISELANICYIRQKVQLGLGHAVLITEDLIGDEPFAVFLPDDIIESEVPVMKQMIEVYERYGCSVIAVETVAPENTATYGIIAPEQVEDRVYQVLDLVEKPNPEEAPSNLGIVGRYIITPEVFDKLKETSPGKGGEIQLTDGLRLLLEQQKIYAYRFEGIRHDTGTPLGFLKASVELGLRSPEVGAAFGEYLRQLELPD
ncbi:MAG: UTP--glucose-1-phosphate uridylyltransferase GalU [Dehalococcoidia bacterium]